MKSNRAVLRRRDGDMSARLNFPRPPSQQLARKIRAPQARQSCFSNGSYFRPAGRSLAQAFASEPDANSDSEPRVPGFKRATLAPFTVNNSIKGVAGGSGYAKVKRVLSHDYDISRSAQDRRAARQQGPQHLADRKPHRGDLCDAENLICNTLLISNSYSP